MSTLHFLLAQYILFPVHSSLQHHSTPLADSPPLPLPLPHSSLPITIHNPTSYHPSPTNTTSNLPHCTGLCVSFLLLFPLVPVSLHHNLVLHLPTVHADHVSTRTISLSHTVSPAQVSLQTSTSCGRAEWLITGIPYQGTFTCLFLCMFTHFFITPQLGYTLRKCPKGIPKMEGDKSISKQAALYILQVGQHTINNVRSLS